MEKVSIESIGCCGSVCMTCKVKKENKCIGCKNGYKNNERVLIKAKCKIKICCISNNYETCADCKQFNNCKIVNEFYGKSGYKYKKYEEANNRKAVRKGRVFGVAVLAPPIHVGPP